MEKQTNPAYTWLHYQLSLYLVILLKQINKQNHPEALILSTSIFRFSVRQNNMKKEANEA